MKDKYMNLINELKKEKDEILEDATELITGDMRDSTSELSLIDNHPADIATEVYERSRDVAIHDRYMHRIQAIDSALQRWEEGKYGVCEHCGQEIPFERLEALPYTTVCTECSRLEEKEEQHSLHREPVEDEILIGRFRGPSTMGLIVLNSMGKIRGRLSPDTEPPIHLRIWARIAISVILTRCMRMPMK